MPLFPPAGSSIPPSPGSTVNLYTNFGDDHTATAKASAGKVFSISCYNFGQVTRFVQLHNSAAPVAGGATALLSFQVPAASTTVIGTDFFLDSGVDFSTGITFAVSDSRETYTQPGSIEHNTQIRYA